MRADTASLQAQYRKLDIERWLPKSIRSVGTEEVIHDRRHAGRGFARMPALMYDLFCGNLPD
jgi:hypothetical protein